MAPRKPWARSAGIHIPLHQDHLRVWEETVQLSGLSLFDSRRVRSIIMLQEKAQDRERLLLKFIKIMKVTAGALPRVCSSGPCPAAPGPPHGLPSLRSTYGS